MRSLVLLLLASAAVALAVVPDNDTIDGVSIEVKGISWPVSYGADELKTSISICADGGASEQGYFSVNAQFTFVTIEPDGTTLTTNSSAGGQAPITATAGSKRCGNIILPGDRKTLRSISINTSKNVQFFRNPVAPPKN